MVLGLCVHEIVKKDQVSGQVSAGSVVELWHSSVLDVEQ